MINRLLAAAYIAGVDLPRGRWRHRKHRWYLDRAAQQWRCRNCDAVALNNEHGRQRVMSGIVVSEKDWRHGQLPGRRFDGCPSLEEVQP